MIGFEKIEQQLFNLYNSNKLHHGIIIAGKKGVGKATFVESFCKKVLQDSATFTANFSKIEKSPDKKTIGIENIREKQKFLNHTTAISSNKFLLIDSVCETTESASNALLKTLEEPKANNFIFLIAHQLSKVLPTIKSRCLIIKIDDFSIEQFSKILSNNNIIFTKNELIFLANITEKSPAIALEFGSEIIKIYQIFIKSILQNKIDDLLLKKISEKNFSYFIIEKIISHFLSQILNKINHLEINFIDDSELMAIDLMIAKFSQNSILDFVNEILKNTQNSNNFHIEKKLNFINIFNQFCYV
jgi:DNA polymerase-3 subunit delta'